MNGLELYQKLIHSSRDSLGMEIVVKINNEFIPLKNVKISKDSDIVENGTIILEVA